MDDNIAEVVGAILAAYDAGELQAAIDGGHDAWNKWIKGMGKNLKRKVFILPITSTVIPLLLLIFRSTCILCIWFYSVELSSNSDMTFGCELADFYTRPSMFGKFLVLAWR